MVIKTKFGTENRGFFFMFQFSLRTPVIVLMKSDVRPESCDREEERLLIFWDAELQIFWLSVSLDIPQIINLKRWSTSVFSLCFQFFFPLLVVWTSNMDTLRILFVVLEPYLWHDNLGVHAHMGPDPLHGGNIGRLKVHPRSYFSYFIRLSSNFSGW